MISLKAYCRKRNREILYRLRIIWYMITSKEPSMFVIRFKTDKESGLKIMDDLSRTDKKLLMIALINNEAACKHEDRMGQAVVDQAMQIIKDAANGKA